MILLKMKQSTAHTTSTSTPQQSRDRALKLFCFQAQWHSQYICDVIGPAGVCAAKHRQGNKRSCRQQRKVRRYSCVSLPRSSFLCFAGPRCPFLTTYKGPAQQVRNLSCSPLTCSPLSRSQPSDMSPAELFAKNSPATKGKTNTSIVLVQNELF